MSGPTKAAERAEGARILSAFLAAGAEPVETEILQPADILLDLYGEDIRARAFTTIGVEGQEAMLRPDFTVPIVRMHMEGGADPARYAYMGEVFRRQTGSSARSPEYLQVGFELFGGDDPAHADAEVFALFHELLMPMGGGVTTGDIGILTAAVHALATTERRKAALLRHLWRPSRFRRMLDRFGGRTDMHPARQALLASDDPMAEAGPEIGLRSRAEVTTRIAALVEDADSEPIAGGELDIVAAILDVTGMSGASLARLREIAVGLPAIGGSLDRLERRLDALAARGIDPDQVPFSASHGRSTMEYYDGFVFSFLGPRNDMPPLATGGRYDALTRVLGAGRVSPAVGGVVRPALLLQGQGA